MFLRREQTTESLSTEVEDGIDKRLKEQFNKPPLRYDGNQEDLKDIRLDTTFDQKGSDILEVFINVCVQHVVCCPSSVTTKFQHLIEIHLCIIYL